MTQETSKAAYFTEVLPTLGERHQEVLKYLAAVENATNSEILEALKWSINRITPRIHELREKGLVEEATERKCRITGRNVKSWRVVKKEKQNPASNYRCFYCPKTAVEYIGKNPCCPQHLSKQVNQLGLL